MIYLALESAKVSKARVAKRVATARQGFVDHGTFVAIHANLPAYLKDPIMFLYLSGWRVSEMKALEWRDVDLSGGVVRLRPEIRKNKDGRVLPLSGDLLDLIGRAREARRPDCPFVFHRDREPIGDFRKAWSAACKAAGLQPILVHDLRRTAVRNMVRAGIADRVAMTLSGHKTRSIFDRYNIVSATDLAQAAERLQAHLTPANLIVADQTASQWAGRPMRTPFSSCCASVHRT